MKPNKMMILYLFKVPGRLYPIEINYRPIIKDPFERKRDKFNCTPYLQILQMIDEKYQPNQKGDALIFLNGFSEISTLADAVTEYRCVCKCWKKLIINRKYVNNYILYNYFILF